MRHFGFVYILLAILTFVAMVGYPQGTGKVRPPDSSDVLIGVVTDRVTAQPVVGASVRLDSANIVVLTDSLGKFLLVNPAVKDSAISLTVLHEGYETFRIFELRRFRFLMPRKLDIVLDSKLSHQESQKGSPGISLKIDYKQVVFGDLRQWSQSSRAYVRLGTRFGPPPGTGGWLLDFWLEVVEVYDDTAALVKYNQIMCSPTNRTLPENKTGWQSPIIIDQEETCFRCQGSEYRVRLVGP